MTSLSTPTHFDSPTLSAMIQARISGNRVAVPIAETAPFTQLKYVQGIPSADGGYPLSKLQVIDTLIDQLVHLKAKESLAKVPPITSDLSDSQQNSLIEDLAKSVHSAMQTTSAIGQSLGASFGILQSQVGAVLNVAV